MWQLIINGPGYFDTVYDLRDGVVHIGRADENDIVLSGDLVSRKHVRLEVSQAHVDAKDLGSRNGCRVNGETLKGHRELKAGDTLLIGENSLALRLGSTVESAATEVVDLGAGGSVKRFGSGQLPGAVLVARDLRDSVVMRVLDNVAFNPSSAPWATEADVPTPQTTITSEHDVPQADGQSPIAWQSLVVLYQVAERLANAPSLQAFLDDTLSSLMKRVGAATGVVLLRHSSGLMVPSAVQHSRALEKGEVPVSDAIVESVLGQGKALAVADVRDDARFSERESVVLYGVDQVLCVPIGKAAPFSGVLYLNRDGVGKEPPEPLLDVCTAVAQLIHSGVQKFEGKASGPGDVRLRGALERFHPPELAERRLKELAGKGGPLTFLEERTVTVLFADLAGFTALAAKLPTEKTAGLLDELYQKATTTLFSFEGTVDKFLGDGVMAIFGAPYGKGDDALRAVRAAVSLRGEWTKAMAKRPPRERCELKVGITTGKALVGTVGNDIRIDHAAVGEPVNQAAALCAAAAPGQVVITGKTLAAIGARFDVTPLGERALGKSKAKVSTFEVLEEDGGTGTVSGVK